MGFLKFSKTPKPQRFEYRPRFYDPETEKFKERRRKASASGGEDDGHEAMKARISGSFRRKKTIDKRKVSRQSRQRNTILIVTLIALLALTAYFIEEYLPTLMRIIE